MYFLNEQKASLGHFYGEYNQLQLRFFSFEQWLPYQTWRGLSAQKFTHN